MDVPAASRLLSIISPAAVWIASELGPLEDSPVEAKFAQSIAEFTEVVTSCIQSIAV
jgi:hypothetical protein